MIDSAILSATEDDSVTEYLCLSNELTLIRHIVLE